jgi:hypothetical protein
MRALSMFLLVLPAAVCSAAVRYTGKPVSVPTLQPAEGAVRSPKQKAPHGEGL